MQAKVWLIVVGALFMLLGVGVTPIIQQMGNTSFWMGFLLLLIGLVLVILDSERGS